MNGVGLNSPDWTESDFTRIPCVRCGRPADLMEELRVCGVVTEETWECPCCSHRWVRRPRPEVVVGG